MSREALWSAARSTPLSHARQTQHSRGESAPERIRTTNLLIRSQMLYPVELRAPFEEQLICGGRRDGQITRKKMKNFRPLSRSDTICSRRVMVSIARKSSTLRSARLNRYAMHCGQESTQAECSAQIPPNDKPTAVHSRNGTTGEQL